ncbi:MAG: hypothetical protein JST62_02175 [Bacteroidetes bacterium]|nr:hypothetical protein [Bacteroidota bacterium]
MLKNKNILLTSLFLIITIVPFIYVTYSLRDTFLDDSYITLTYSKHFFQIGKPWYNIIDKIQGNGQTSVLWMLIQSVFFNFKNINAIYINKCISFFCVLIVIYSLLKSYIAHKSILIKIIILLFSVFFSTSSALNISHGLETVFFASVLFLFLKYRNNKIVYFIAFLLPFIRPESIVFTLFFVIDTKFFSTLFYKRLLTVLLSIVCYLLYTTYYYDVLLPLPFLLKNTQEFSFEKISNFISVIVIFSPIIILVVKNYKTKFIFYAPLFFFIVYYSFFIDDVMNFFDRYRYPLFVYYVFFLCYEDFEVFKNKKINIILFVASFIGIYSYCKYIEKHVRFLLDSYSYSMTNGPIYIGNYFREISKSENKKLKIINSDAGAIAYYSDCYLYDTWGLNNASLLLYKKDKNWTAYQSYLKQVHPDYIVLISKDPHKFIPRLDFEWKIYEYFTLNNQKPIMVKKSMEEYYYFIYKVSNP